MVQFTRSMACWLGVVVCLFTGLMCDARASTPVCFESFWQEVAQHRESQSGLTQPDVLAVRLDREGHVVAETPDGPFVWHSERNTWRRDDAVNLQEVVEGPDGVDVRQVATSSAGEQVAATSHGLFVRRPDADWRRLVVSDGLGRQWGTADVRGVAFGGDGSLWFASLAGVGRRQADQWRFYEGKDGLPFNDFTCVATGDDGSVWFGTRRGAIRFQHDQWAYRQGLRWLPHDDVRDIVVDRDGTTWFATAGGVGRIALVSMTFDEKAAYYEAEMERLIRRTEFGYVAEATLPAPGDRTSSVHHDSDNDGLWTSMYGASQCFAYGATGSPEHRRRAEQAFQSLRHLQRVTQGGQHSPPPGYVARTVLPITHPDPNVGRIEQDRQFRDTRDPLWKVYEPRWPVSADGKWYWKSDTSSDELDGHYFFYAAYYDLVAETSAQRNAVREVVAALTDHLISHGFRLIDHDGQPTRWGVFDPESLNHNPDWTIERGLNSLSMLSYLSVARHVTGDERYTTALRKLVDDHAYLANLMVPKVQTGIGSGNQSDDEMAFMGFYNLIKYTHDQALRRQFLIAFRQYWQLEQPERNPFFNFAYAAVADGVEIKIGLRNVDLSPEGDWWLDSINTLREFPLDRADWSHANSHRIDLMRLPVPHGSLSELGERGYRVDGKVLPVSERYFAHWNTDPWQLDYGGSGQSLGSGTVYLLPYYMGRYHGFLDRAIQ